MSREKAGDVSDHVTDTAIRTAAIVLKLGGC